MNASFKPAVSILVLYLLGSLAWAQEDLPWRLGPGPGATIALPEATTVQGEAVRANVPTLVFFTRLDGSDSAYEVAALGSAWQSRHPSMQVLLVDTRRPPEQVRDWVNAAGISVGVIADEEDDAFEEAFDTNRLPILYLLDERGVVQDKVVGSDLERYIGLDEVLAWAATGEWDRVAMQRSEWLTVGEKPARSLEDVPLGEGRRVVVYHTRPFCVPCDRITEGNFQEELNLLAAKYQDVSFIILEPDLSQLSSVDWFREIADTFITLYGRDALPGDILLTLERGRAPALESTGIPWEGWEPNITYVPYQTTSLNNPTRWWGQVLTPGLMMFDEQGVYVGLAPLWEGPYDLSSLVQVIDAALSN